MTEVRYLDCLMWEPPCLGRWSTPCRGNRDVPNLTPNGKLDQLWRKKTTCRLCNPLPYNFPPFFGKYSSELPAGRSALSQRISFNMPVDQSLVRWDAGPTLVLEFCRGSIRSTGSRMMMQDSPCPNFRLLLKDTGIWPWAWPWAWPGPSFMRRFASGPWEETGY